MPDRTQRIVIVDLGVGNIRSVAHSLSVLGATPLITADPKEIEGADRVILPGVGAFGEYKHQLDAKGLTEVLTREVRERGKPMMGICLGMQVLGSVSEELGEFNGLGWIPGRVKRLSVEVAPHLRVPHMGWNSLRVARETPVLDGITADSMFYFVHSYALHPDDRRDVVAECEHGVVFCAAVQRDNIVATQFHPEKSQRDGLALLDRFLKWKP